MGRWETRSLVYPATWLVQSVQEKGLLRTLKIAYHVFADFSFDWRHGTETTRWVKVERFETPSGNKAHAVHYQASKAGPARRLFQKLALPTDGAFVDLGCGKGRMLMLASQLGFTRVVGVEFCSRLCAQARINASRFQRRSPRSVAIEIVESDAACHQFRGDESVFYLYNPFNEVVLTQTLRNIARSVKESPRAVWVVYNTPLHHDAVVRSGYFGRHEHFEIGGSEFQVYSEFIGR